MVLKESKLQLVFEESIDDSGGKSRTKSLMFWYGGRQIRANIRYYLASLLIFMQSLACQLK
jgi:hypothetical protein